MDKIIIIIKIIVGFPIYYFSIVFPKNKNLAVIGCSLGKHFADNSKYYYINHYNSLEAKKQKNLVWISKNKEIIKYLNSLGLPAKFLYSFGGVWTILRASRAFISHQLTDINGPLMGGAKIIQLWHGMALRKIGYGGDWSDNNLKGKIHSFISKWFPYAYYMKCDILYVPCQKAKDNSIEPFSKSFRNNKISENIYLARQSRMLCFDNDFDLSNEFFPEKELLLSFTNKYNKIISWLPTHRKLFKETLIDVISDSHLNLRKLNNFCKSNNYLFVIKAHFLDFDEISNIVQNLDFIFVYPHADPYPLLKYTNILITDYSSVFFDFLLLEKPIIFMCHDLEKYAIKMGFYFDYERLEIGPICKTWQEVINAISYISYKKDRFIVERKEKLNSYNFVASYDLNLTKIT